MKIEIKQKALDGKGEFLYSIKFEGTKEDIKILIDALKLTV